MGTTNRLALLAGGLLVGALLSLLVGAAPLGAGDILMVGIDRLGFSASPDPQAELVLIGIRLPRSLVAVVVGYGLGIAGAALQGLMGNPFADGQLLGIAPAAGLGTLVGFALSTSGVSSILTQLAIVLMSAIAGSLFSLLLGRIPDASSNGGHLSLVGAALSLGLTAWLGTIVLAWDSDRVPTLTFWIFGGLTGATWRGLYGAAFVTAVGAAVLHRHARSLDLLALGEADARHLGVPVDRVRRVVLIAAGAVVGAGVSVAGVIGFVGLLAPRLVLRTLGPAHRSLLLGSGMAGALTLLAADSVARTVASPTEVPVGMIMGMIGAPVMVWSLARPESPWRTQ